MSNWAICHGISLFFITFLIIDVVNGRWLEVGMFPTSTISEGVANKFHENTPDLHMMVSNSSESTTTLYAQKRCHSIYGLLPCADKVQEGLALMVIYTCLMTLGEEWIDKGSPALFIDRVLGASVFRVVKALPKIVIIIVSGVLATTSDAQHKVAFAVSFYAGSTVITLTLIWGLRIILCREKLRGKVSAQKSDDKQHSCVGQKLLVLCDTGVNIDKETGKLAVIMLLSLIPFATVELVIIFKSRIIILLALILSGVSLVLYFAYQIWGPLIKARSLAYLKQENLLTQFFDLVKGLDHLDEKGVPKSKAFDSIFERADIDKDNSISDEELEILFLKEWENDQISKEYAKDEIFRHLDEDGSGKIDRPEYEKGYTKLKNVANNSDLVSKNIWKQATVNDRRNKLTQIGIIMPRILKLLLKNHQIVTEGGKANREKIEGLFSNFDDDKNQEIERAELKKFIETFQFGVSLEVDAILDAIMNDFNNDADRHSSINKKKFVDGFVKWIEKAINRDPTIKDPKHAIAKFDKDSWGEIDAYMKREPKATIMYAICGVGIISVISGAFVQSVVQFSNAAHISFLFTSFVIAPLAMNIRIIITALLDAASHISKNASLTISEIYNGLIMDNLMGLATLLATVYIKGLSWRYTAEVVTIMMPCTIVGLFSLRRDTYPLWASLCAILLYPVSVYVHYVLH
ncbi:hypothetical protein L1887_17405 [Cichorium endivia]|nr:hypothetical protein L1887_17405 [Cichorium endivia]